LEENYPQNGIFDFFYFNGMTERFHQMTFELNKNAQCLLNTMKRAPVKRNEFSRRRIIGNDKTERREEEFGSFFCGFEGAFNFDGLNHSAIS
jgi:hypothetical protein